MQKQSYQLFLRMNGILSLRNKNLSLDIVTENPAIARRIFSLMKIAYKIEPVLLVSQKMKLKKE